jgi:hypothetical protein
MAEGVGVDIQTGPLAKAEEERVEPKQRWGGSSRLTSSSG